MEKKRKSTLIRKIQIIDAARKIIIRKGSEHLTLRAMAREVGFSEAAIYRHFKNKSEVLSFLMNTIMDEMLHELINGVAEDPKGLNAIDAVLKHHLSGIEQRRGISFQIIAEIISLGDKKLNERVYIKLTEYLRWIRTFLADGARVNSIRNDIDLDAASLLLFGMIQGVVNIWALSGYNFDLIAKYEALWSIYQKAIKTQERKRSNIYIENNCRVLRKAHIKKKLLEPHGYAFKQ